MGKKADINYILKFKIHDDERAKTPLTAAVLGGHAEVVKFLINRKAYVNLAEPCNGWTALHCAVVGRNMLMIELLMSKGAKHDVKDNPRDSGSKTDSILGSATWRGPLELVQRLVDAGADVNQTDSSNLRTLRSTPHLTKVIWTSSSILLRRELS